MSSCQSVSDPSESLLDEQIVKFCLTNLHQLKKKHHQGTMTSWRITTSPMKDWSGQAVLTWALRLSTLPRHSRQSTIMQSTSTYAKYKCIFKVQVFMQSTCAIPQYRYKYLHSILILQVSWVVVGQDGKSLYCMHEVFVLQKSYFLP